MTANMMKRGGCLLALLPAGCASGVLDPHGPVARAEKVILVDATIIMLAVIVPIMIATVAFAWWFRAGNPRAKYRPDWAHSGRLELIVWAVPALIVLFLSGIAWIGTHKLHPPEPLESTVPPIEVQVVSLDWKWLFIYPAQGVATINRLVIPAGVPVRFSLTSASVMNSFFIPRLGSMIYTMSGMETRLNLMADRPATHVGMSAMYSGDGFSDMRFAVDAVPPAAFNAWAARTRASGGRLDDRSYRFLLRQNDKHPKAYYGSVQPGLFDRIVREHEPPGRGATHGHPTPQVSPRSE